jgi:hypothetical protein
MYQYSLPDELPNVNSLDYKTGHYNKCDWLKRQLHNKILNRQRIPCKCSLTKNNECSALICSQSCLEINDGTLYGECYKSWKKTCKVNIFDPCLCRCINEYCDKQNISLKERKLITPENFEKILQIPYNYENNHLSEKRIKKSSKNNYESDSDSDSDDLNNDNKFRKQPTRKVKNNTNAINYKIMLAENMSSSESEDSLIESTECSVEDESTNTNTNIKRKFSFDNNKPSKKPKNISYNTMGTCFSESSSEDY